MPYTQMKTAALPVPVVATEGVHLILADGTRLVDGIASWWTAAHGYNHPHIVAAVREQLERMPHVMFGGVHHEPALRLAKRLAALLPGDLNHVFFADSGSVSVEVALKMAVQYWLNQGVRGRTRFVAFADGYHGDTTGAMSLCDPVRSMHAHFKGFLLEQFPQRIPRTADDEQAFDAFVAERADQIAGVIIEPLIQGAGGMRFHEPESLRILRRVCDRHGLLLVADEIATGFGRTGTMFASEQAGVVPDIMCIGKALTGGTMTMAAAVATTRVFEAFLSDDPAHALMHGPTYMANPLACAAANASLDLFEIEPRLEQVHRIEQQMRDQLDPCRDMPGVVDVRVKGAVGVVQVEELGDRDQWIAGFRKRGAWIRPTRDVIYLTPPLVISEGDLSLLCAAIVAGVHARSCR
jgi:adenosylmethionine-8-amino-7-oxononanoate aminotransferase